MSFEANFQRLCRLQTLELMAADMPCIPKLCTSDASRATDQCCFTPDSAKGNEFACTQSAEISRVKPAHLLCSNFGGQTYLGASCSFWACPLCWLQQLHWQLQQQLLDPGAASAVAVSSDAHRPREIQSTACQGMPQTVQCTAPPTKYPSKCLLQTSHVHSELASQGSAAGVQLGC